MGTGSVARAVARRLSKGLQQLAAQDYVLLAYHAFMWLRVLRAPDGIDATHARSTTLVLLLATIVGLALVRGEVVGPGPLRAILYRVVTFVPAAFSYFELRALLHALRPRLVDDTLLQIDVALFGDTPARMLERISTPGVIEWFSFFYLSYFFILAGHLVPVLTCGRGKHLAQLTFGALIVCAVGQIMYTIVPGAGPCVHVAFEHAISGGPFWGAVRGAVASAGAQLDIFPSLHTAYPTFFALYWARNRRDGAPWRYWPVAAFVAVNVIIATMLLRWHYAIDVVAGLTLGTVAVLVAERVAALEATRSARGLQPTWEPITAEIPAPAHPSAARDHTPRPY